MANSGSHFQLFLLSGCVGKTSLVLRYCNNQFNDKHVATLHASFLTKRINVDGRRVELNIWVRRRVLDGLAFIL